MNLCIVRLGTARARDEGLRIGTPRAPDVGLRIGTAAAARRAQRPAGVRR